MYKIGRIQAMSDGLFAILITILVLDFRVPDYKAGYLFQSVVDQWPILLAYIISFFYVGTLWLFHHDFFVTIERTTPTLNILNLLVLFSITLINYPTALIAETLAQTNLADLRTAVVIYALTALLINATFEILYRYVYLHPQLKAKNSSAIRSSYYDPIISDGIYVVSIILSFFIVWVGAGFLLGGIVWHAMGYLRFSQKVIAGLPKSK